MTYITIAGFIILLIGIIDLYVSLNKNASILNRIARIVDADTLVFLNMLEDKGVITKDDREVFIDQVEIRYKSNKELTGAQNVTKMFAQLKGDSNFVRKVKETTTDQ